jgi:hypothetical protein
MPTNILLTVGRTGVEPQRGAIVNIASIAGIVGIASGGGVGSPYQSTLIHTYTDTNIF